MPALFSLAPMRRFMFRTISQTAIQYRASALSHGSAGEVHGRRPAALDRAGHRTDDNYAPLAALDWQVHVYGGRRPRSPTCARRAGSRCMRSPGANRCAHRAWHRTPLSAEARRLCRLRGPWPRRRGIGPLSRNVGATCPRSTLTPSPTIVLHHVAVVLRANAPSDDIHCGADHSSWTDASIALWQRSHAALLFCLDSRRSR